LGGGEIQFAGLPGKARIFLEWFGGLLIVTSMGLCIGFDVYRQFGLAEPQHLNQSYVQWDGYILNRAEPGRGVFLKFVNFRGQWAGYATNIYFRAVYVMYPRPVLVARPGDVLNKPFQVLAANSYPSEKWLWDHGVGSIIIVDFDPVRTQPFVAGVKWLGR
jgi:hypothetical protein